MMRLNPPTFDADADATTTERLAARGYVHRGPTDEDRAWARARGGGNAADVGRRMIVDLRTGERIGLMNCFEANDWIAAGCPRTEGNKPEEALILVDLYTGQLEGIAP